MIAKPKTVIVIPTRMGSTRYPGKPKVQIAGMTLIERVWRIAKASTLADEVLIGTPDPELVEFAESFGARAILTSPDHLNGTDCVAEVIRKIEDVFDIIVNLQGDAVLTPPWVIDDLIQDMLDNPQTEMNTPAERMIGDVKRAFVEAKKRGSTSGTTVVFDLKGNAMYFSKGIVPHEREYSEETPIFHHIGLYSWKPECLQRIAALPETELERIEKLEFLRAMEHGIPIRIVVVDFKGRCHASVDHPEDVEIAEGLIAQQGELLG